VYAPVDRYFQPPSLTMNTITPSEISVAPRIVFDRRRWTPSTVANVCSSHVRQEAPVPMLWFAGCVIAAALLWLGPEIGLAARSRPPRLAWGLKACAVALTTCGLWWPGHLAAGAEPPGANAGLMAVVSWTIGLGLAMLTTVIAAAAARKTVAAFLALSVVAVLLAYGHAMLAMPTLFRAAMIVGPWAPGASAGRGTPPRSS